MSVMWQMLLVSEVAFSLLSVLNGSSWNGYKSIQAQSSSEWSLLSGEVVIKFVLSNNIIISLVELLHAY